MSRTSITCRYFYVGHGSMNLLDIRKDNQTVCMMLIDAGTRPRVPEPPEELLFYDMIQNSISTVSVQLKQALEADVPVYVFVTHHHIDHFNFLTNQLRTFVEAAYAIYIPCPPSDDAWGPEDRELFLMAQQMQMDGKNVVFIQDVLQAGREDRMLEIPLPDILEDSVQMCCWTPYAGSEGLREPNSVGTIYGIRMKEEHNAMLFTGDMDATMMCAIQRNSCVQISIRNFFERIPDSPPHIITVPHHGSYHSLVQESGMVGWTLSLNEIKELFINMNLYDAIYVISASANYMDEHPRYETIRFFLENIRTKPFSAKNHVSDFDIFGRIIVLDGEQRYHYVYLSPMHLSCTFSHIMKRNASEPDLWAECNPRELIDKVSDFACIHII